jgi:hypothetical protein
MSPQPFFRLFIFFLFSVLSTCAVAQKIKLVSGDLKALKSESSFAMKFQYDNMVIGGDRIPEKEYLRTKRNDWEAKEEGKGSDFVKMWFEDRKAYYEPAFIKGFEEYSKITLGSDSAKYTFILRTTRTEGGWSIGVMAHPGELDGQLLIVESANPSNIIARIVFTGLIGKYTSTDDFDMTKRIESAYLMAGDGLGDFFRRKAR